LTAIVCGKLFPPFQRTVLFTPNEFSFQENFRKTY
jgi:hypothetical protein